jgi:Transposase DDE domain/DDE_Tnp_1-associated
MGIPSHDTLERVFDRLDPKAFQACFRQWVQAVGAALPIKHIAIDGKTLRASGSAKLGPLYLVSAWATAQHLTLGQVAVAEKSNEITAIPALLELLELHGAWVTIDAMGCQKDIARTIRERGGDYVLTVKSRRLLMPLRVFPWDFLMNSWGTRIRTWIPCFGVASA